MNGLDEFALHWCNWMLSAGWQAAVVAVAVAIILRLGRNRISSQMKYALLLIVLIKFATPPFFYFYTGLFSQPAVARISEVGFSGSQNPTRNLAFGFPAGNISELANPSENSQLLMKDVPSTAPATATAKASASEFKSTQAVLSADFPWLSGLLLVYGAGVVLVSVRSAASLWRIRRIVAQSERKTSGVLFTELAEVAKRVNLRSKPQLRVSDNAQAPFATGVLRPIVVLPRQMMMGLSADQRKIVMAHELLHIRHRDLLIGWLELLLGMLWWFHPAMWWLRKSLRQTREDCCDDVLVARELAAPERYCETLIDAATCQLTTNLEPIALGFASREHPAGRRIRRLMDDTIFRDRRIRGSAICFAALVALVALPGIRTAPADPGERPGQELAQEKGTEEQKLEKEVEELGTPRRFTGKIVDENGTAIEGASVELNALSYSNNWKDRFELAKKKLVTDEDGKWTLDINKKAKDGHSICINVTADSKTCFRRYRFDTDFDRNAEAVELKPLTLMRGVLVTGRVTAPDSQSDAPRDAAVTVAVNYSADSIRRENFSRSLNCDAKGKFQCVVPAKSELSVNATAANYASLTDKFKIKSGAAMVATDELGKHDIGDLQLLHGVSVYGVAKRLDGTPAAGVVVVIKEGNPSTAAPGDLASAKTDAKGRFRLPPVTGNCVLFTLEQCWRRKVIKGEQQYFKSDGKIPMFDTVYVDLKGKGREYEVELKEAEEVTVSGKILFENGTPVANLHIAAGWQTDVGPLYTADLHTDKSGKYSHRIPKGSTPYFVFANHFIDRDMYEPFLDRSSVKLHRDLVANTSERRCEDVEFKPAKESVADLDWVAIKYIPKRERFLNRAGAWARFWFLGE